MVQALDISPETAQVLRREYHHRYGTTMAGLLRHHPGADVEDYLETVHRVDVTKYLNPDPQLAAMLARLPVGKVVFTNAIASWAERILTCLGVHEHFERIVDVRDVGYMAKPRPEAYAQLLTLLEVDGASCVLLDDQAPNLRTAAQFGMRTILVRSDQLPGEDADYVVGTVLEAEPLLWQILNGTA